MIAVFNESGKGYWMWGVGCLRAEGENRPSRPTHVVVLNDQGGSVKSSNPHSGIHETDVTKCLDTRCLEPSCNQGGCMVVAFRKTTHPHNVQEGQGYEQTDTADTLNAFDEGENRTPMLIVYPKRVIALEGHGARPSHMGNGYSDCGTMYTLNTIEQHSVCYSVDCRNLCLNEEKSGTLQAKNQGGFSYNYLNPVLMEKDK